jgi:hypothetical protein
MAAYRKVRVRQIEVADNPGGLNGSTQHSAQNPHSLKTKAKSAG